MSCLPRVAVPRKVRRRRSSPGLERLVKPDPRIYRVFCERYGLAPESCVFIDDSEPNVISARKIGMNGDPLHDAEQLRKELIGLGCR